MVTGHDFKRFPELTNRQMQLYYFQSPHKQITEDFRAKVTKVTDGDTIRVYWKDRDFTFPIRFLYNASPELDEKGGIAAQKFLSKKILGRMVDIRINPRTRVEKWGRLLGEVFFEGLSMGETMLSAGYAIKFTDLERG